MPKVEVIKPFRWAPDGVNVGTVEVGRVLEGRGADIALELGCGRVLGETAQAPQANRAHSGAPRNKGRE